MKRSKCVQLSLSAAVAVAITGCQPDEPNYQVSKTFKFDTVQQCVDQKVPVDICSEAYMAAMAEHRRIAPTYDSQAECDADFIENYCKANSDGKFTPPLSGFALTADGIVTEGQLNAAHANAGSGGSGASGLNDVVMGMLIGNMLSNNGGRYYSEPVYRYRSDRGSYSTSTLASRIKSGTTFSNSTQAKRGISYASNSKPGIKPSINTKPIAVKTATSRGGFGKVASARGGWGGSFGG